MTALNTTLRFLSDPKCTEKIMHLAVRHCMILQYYKPKPGQTIAIKR